MESGLDVDVRHRLSRLDLRVAVSAGRETLALVGPSGAGKTTVLRIVAGLVRPDEGRVVLSGRTLLDTRGGTDLPSERRRIGMVFQDGALFPHLTVAANVVFGLRHNGSPRAHRGNRVAGILERFGIQRLAGAHPADLSGGERQRVALARAVAADPQALLLDEPLSALDPQTKGRVAAELAGHLRELRLPAVLVSHDFADVVGLAERVAVMEGGRLVQAGTPAELVQAPRSAFVAAFTGVNYFEGKAVRRGELTEVRSPAGAALFVSTDEAAGPVGVVIHPWDVAVSLGRPEGSALNALAGRVHRVAALGNRARVTVDSSPPVVAEVTEESVRRLGLRPGVPVVATWKATGTRLVPRSGPEDGDPDGAENVE